QKRQARVRALERQAHVAFRERIDSLLAATAAANVNLRTVAEGILFAVGFHKHHRGEWRMRRGLKEPKARIEQVSGGGGGEGALVRLVKYDAAPDDAEAVAVFAKARSGDGAAIDRVRALIRERDWLDWLGDLGRQATRQLIAKAAGGDPVWEAGITLKAN